MVQKIRKRKKRPRKNLLSIRAFCAKYGKANAMIRPYIKSGMIPVVKEEKGAKLIDEDQAIEYLKNNTQMKLGAITLNPDNSGKIDAKKFKEFADAKTDSEKLKARKLQLEVDALEKTLISINEIGDLFYQAFSTVKIALLNLPSRISPLLVSENNEHKIHEIIKNEVTIMLDNLVTKKLNEIVDKKTN